MVWVTIVAHGVSEKVRAISVNIPSRRRRRRHGSLVRLAALGVAFVLALGLGAGVAFVSRGGLYLPGGAEPPRQAAGDPLGTEPSRADATTTSIEDTRKEGEEGDTTGAHDIGVWYDAEARRWAIFNQDLAPMARGTSFDVHVLSEGGSAFVHRATAENTVGDETYLDDPLTDAEHDAPPSVAQNWNPGGVVGGTYNDHPVGVRYDADVKQWVIFNEDGEAMPEGVDFNVTVFPLGEPAFVQRATPANVTENRTYVDDPLVNGDPDAILFAIPRQRGG